MPARDGRGQSDGWPQFLPDGHRFVYLRQEGPSSQMGATVYLGTLEGAAGRPVLGGVFNALFLLPGVLVFTDAHAVKVQRIDLDSGRMIGDVEQLALDVDRHLGRAAIALSRDGTLVYAAADSEEHRLVWFDRSGHETGVVAANDGWRDIALSPDGLHVAVQRIVPDANDIWTIDLERGVPSRFTFSPDVDDDPVWSPDGAAIAFSSIRNGIPGIYRQSVGRGADDELVFSNREPLHPTDWSPDGRVLLFEQANSASAADVWALPLQGDRTPRPYLATRFSETDGHFSADGKWVAYMSDESGRNEIYVQSFPDAHAKLQISTRGGVSPRWARSGRELYFLSRDRQLMAVTIELTNPLRIGPSVALFDTSVDLGESRYAAAGDGKRFLLSVGSPETKAASLLVVVNWADHLAVTEPRH